MVNAGFVCGTTTPTPSNLPVNTVVSTSPAVGTFQPKGTTINLNVSSGPATVTVMNVVGDTQAQADDRPAGPGPHGRGELRRPTGHHHHGHDPARRRYGLEPDPSRGAVGQRVVVGHHLRGARRLG